MLLVVAEPVDDERIDVTVIPVALSVALTNVVFAVTTGTPVPALIVVVTETTGFKLEMREERVPLRDERTALTDDAAAEGARVLLVERAEKKVVVGGGSVSVEVEVAS